MFIAAVALGVCLVVPSNATVVDAFRAPECDRCAGNRGIEFAVAEGSAVTTGVAGTVSFTGSVGGKNYVVVRAAANPRVRVTYGGLAALHRQQGDVLGLGDSVGTATARLHLGVRVGDHYIDPLRLTQVSTGLHSSTGSPTNWAVAAPRYRVTLGARPRGNCR